MGNHKSLYSLSKEDIEEHRDEIEAKIQRQIRESRIKKKRGQSVNLMERANRPYTYRWWCKEFPMDPISIVSPSTERSRSYKLRYPERVKANALVTKTIASGGLVMQPCEHEGCEEVKSIHAHHWSYKVENWLDVVWLCFKHHRQEHRRIKKAGECID